MSCRNDEFHLRQSGFRVTEVRTEKLRENRGFWVFFGLETSYLFAVGDVGSGEGCVRRQGSELFFGHELVELVLEVPGFVVKKPVFIIVRRP